MLKKLTFAAFILAAAGAHAEAPESVQVPNISTTPNGQTGPLTPEQIKERAKKRAEELKKKATGATGADKTNGNTQDQQQTPAAPQSSRGITTRSKAVAQTTTTQQTPSNAPTTPQKLKEPYTGPTEKSTGKEPFQMMPRKEPMQDLSKPYTSPKTDTLTITAIAVNDPSLTTFTKALQVSGFENTLKGNGPFTIFIPNDAAFAKLSPQKVAELLAPENKDKLAKFLNNHIVAGKLSDKELKTAKLKTLGDKQLDVKVSDEGATVNNNKIVKTNKAANGVVYIVDTVLAN